MPFLTNCGTTSNTHQFRMLIRNHNAIVHLVLTIYAAISAVTLSTARLMDRAMYGFLIAAQEEQLLIHILEFALASTRCCWHPLCEICTIKDPPTRRPTRARDNF